MYYAKRGQAGSLSPVAARTTLLLNQDQVQNIRERGCGATATHPYPDCDGRRLHTRLRVVRHRCAKANQRALGTVKWPGVPQPVYKIKGPVPTQRATIDAMPTLEGKDELIHGVGRVKPLAFVCV
jgi:hypothetical protein